MVSITIVTWNSERYLDECFAALERQDYRECEVVIIDNASSDGTREKLRQVEGRWKVIYNQTNVGFAAGQNQAIRASQGDWVLCLNPDVVASPDFVTQLVAAGEAHPEVGVVCGKLLRWEPSAHEALEQQIPRGLKPARDDINKGRNSTPEGVPLQYRAASTIDASMPFQTAAHSNLNEDPRKTNIIDSTGIYFTRNMRHLDRGAEEVDHGQYDRVQYVFGATGAAAMFRRGFIEEVSVEGQFFDEEFFSFREDADLAWRAQVMGWKCLYTPKAVAWHVRRVTPERRRDLPLVINWHSVKNRFLMRGKNASGWLCRRLFLPVAWRDLMTMGYALVRDQRLLSAMLYPWRNRESVRRKRESIQSRRKVSDRDLLWWFSNRPRAVDAVASRQHSAVGTQPSEITPKHDE